jgi:CRP-like cAMP-binding protein
MEEHPTELREEPPPAADSLGFDRDARVFGAGVERTREMEAARTVIRLGAGERLSHRPPSDLVIRQGNLRVSEQLSDGREVTRAVLQTGAVCRVRRGIGPGRSEAAGSPLYSLARTTLVALSDTEIWQLPAGFCDPD